MRYTSRNYPGLIARYVLLMLLQLCCNDSLKAEHLFEKEEDTVGNSEVKPSLKFTRHVEVYYSYDFNRPASNRRPDFVYSHNRNNEINVNLAYLKTSYLAARVRANVAIATGTYINANYVNESGVLRTIYEGNIGVKLLRKKSLWIDVGVFPSHIGFESAHTPSCWTLTRSILADNSPYFETGARLGYTSDNGEWYVAAFLLNGWQRIQRVAGSRWLSNGTQVTYTPSDKVTLNYSTFIGDDKPDSLSALRIFHNLYGIFNLTDKFGIIAGVDYGTQDKVMQSGWSHWLGTAFIARYKFTATTALAARVEYYGDRDQVIIETGTPDGFSTAAASLNFDYYIMKNVLCRVEVKGYDSEDAIFMDGARSVTDIDCIATTSLSVGF